jgi:hypothetical protein
VIIIAFSHKKPKTWVHDPAQYIADAEKYFIESGVNK